MNEFGNLIVSLRKKYNMTQKELAEKLNVSDKAVSRWETGKNYPDIEVLKMIADIFNTTIDDVLQGNDITKNRKKRRLTRCFIIIISISIFLYIFPIHHLFSVTYNNYYGAEEIFYLLYKGKISHRLEVDEIVKQAKVELSKRGEQGDAKVKVWSVHLETYTSQYDGYIWMAYTENGWYNYPVLLCLDKEDEGVDSGWRVVEIKEAP